MSAARMPDDERPVTIGFWHEGERYEVGADVEVLYKGPGGLQVQLWVSPRGRYWGLNGSAVIQGAGQSVVTELIEASRRLIAASAAHNPAC